LLLGTSLVNRSLAAAPGLSLGARVLYDADARGLLNNDLSPFNPFGSPVGRRIIIPLPVSFAAQSALGRRWRILGVGRSIQTWHFGILSVAIARNKLPAD
jgi:hypothetical protein